MRFSRLSIDDELEIRSLFARYGHLADAGDPAFGSLLMAVGRRDPHVIIALNRAHQHPPSPRRGRRAREDGVRPNPIPSAFLNPQISSITLPFPF